MRLAASVQSHAPPEAPAAGGIEVAAAMLPAPAALADLGDTAGNRRRGRRLGLDGRGRGRAEREG